MSANSLDGQVGLFFVIDGDIKLYSCPFDEAESGGDFENYPQSHDEVWQRDFAAKYQVDFDYFPRGRIVYSVVDKIYTLYYDTCAAESAAAIAARYPAGKCLLAMDEHYQCARCNENYVV